MSKTNYRSADPSHVPLGDWLRRLREERHLPLREEAEAAGMDLANLQKFDLVVRAEGQIVGRCGT